jgi:hypothetical protein
LQLQLALFLLRTRSVLSRFRDTTANFDLKKIAKMRSVCMLAVNLTLKAVQMRQAVD